MVSDYDYDGLTLHSLLAPKEIIKLSLNRDTRHTRHSHHEADSRASIPQGLLGSFSEQKLLQVG